MNNLKTSRGHSETINRDEPLRKVSRLAVASLVFSILGFGSFTMSFAYGFIEGVDISIVPSAVALVLGIIALAVIASYRSELRGYGYAIAAIILVIPCVSFVTIANISIRVRAEYEKANTPKYNLRLLGEAISKYAETHDGYLPAANQWCDLLMEQDKNLSKDNFKHPMADRLGLSGCCHFAFNKNLDCLRLADIPDNVVLIFEADGDWNLTGTSELLETRRTGHGYIHMLFADQTIWDYWFYEEGVRGKYSYTHKPPRWKP